MDEQHAYWIVSVPAEGNKKYVFSQLQKKVTSDLGETFEFVLPDLRIGTLDAMMGLSDDLSRMDPYIESVTKKIARQLSDMGPKDKSHTFMINMVKLPHFLRNFSWDEPRYPLHASTAHMATQMLSEVKGIEEQFKGKLQEYSAAKTAISNAERKAQYVQPPKWLKRSSRIRQCRFYFCFIFLFIYYYPPQLLALYVKPEMICTKGLKDFHNHCHSHVMNNSSSS
eukprot:TRINITY_DN2249_c0_g1_i3.p1 TRINITY_DN2249_c0_g1~~TRINITY_DN2249_c0_g1_i3.p1  ORF type:complete len:225 (-),score=22.69 TRINITY_DN2249_c0_g1_i3:83-757(-)